jgi:hypothetical protein
MGPFPEEREEKQADKHRSHTMPMPDFFSYNIIHFIVLIACMFKEMKYICN